MDHLCFLCLVFLMLLRLFIATLRSLAGKGLTNCGSMYVKKVMKLVGFIVEHSL